MSGIPSSRRPATLASLAAELGVSRTTVSNAYNRPDQLSAPLRARVLEAARRLGYPGPDPVARSLRTRKAGAVGLLLTEALSYAFRDPAATGFLEGLALACEEAGQGLLLVPVSPEQADVTAVHQAGVDGFANETTHTGRPSTRAVPRTCAFVAREPHAGCGTRSTGSCCERRHGAPGRSRSQRRSPSTIADAPLRIRYSTSSGAFSVHLVTSPAFGLERRDSM